MGCDVEQEATDAFVELAVYILQQRYGDEWRKHAPQSLISYYDDMMKRKQEQADSEDGQETDQMEKRTHQMEGLPVI